ncbi:MAG TPA: hypothetical protein VF622_06740 [Segetibacter sp.]|jgi:O-antigen/teichoic acid export membrane protein
MRSVFKGFYNKAGLDASIIYTILSRVIQSIGGVVTLLLITQFLNTNEQGYYYTFSSILSIQIFFELGLTAIITQYVAHEVAHLNWKSNSELEGDEYYLSRLAHIIKLGIVWILIISVVLFFVFLFSGQYFFSKYNDELNISWETPWIIFSIAASLLVVVNLLFAIIEGLGKVKEVTQLRFLQQAFQFIFIIVFFLFNFKLLSSGLALLLSTTVTTIALFASGHLKIISNLWGKKTTWKVDYKKEVLPFQSKIALGNMSGYLIYSLITPVLFATQSAVIAGQMGATQTFLNGILVVSLSWFSTKVALFSTFVARKQYDLLKHAYEKNLYISIAICSAGILFFTIMVSLLREYVPEIGNRFLTTVPIILLGLTQVASAIGNAQAYYLRSFKQEPFFAPSIVIGVASGVATVLCGKLFGITEITLAYFLINGVIGFLWGCFIFRVKAYEWTNIRRWF